jgi:ABC-type proline/glycine betaine transport system ATPase subunit
VTRTNEDLSLLKSGNDYWKATLKYWDNQQDLRQPQICKEFGELRQETRQQTNENHERLAKQMQAEMKAQVEKMRRQQYNIIKKIRVAENKIEEADNDAETVDKTDMEMMRNFHMRNESPLPLPPCGENWVLLGFSLQEAAVDKSSQLRIHHQATQPTKINHHNRNKTDM